MLQHVYTMCVYARAKRVLYYIQTWFYTNAYKYANVIHIVVICSEKRYNTAINMSNNVTNVVAAFLSCQKAVSRVAFYCVSILYMR